MLALLDVLGIERAGYLGHDWGGWTGWLLALRAPERLTRLMPLSIVHPWTPRGAALRNAWRLAYQFPLAAPVLGPALVATAGRRALRARDGRATAAVYADVLRDPARATRRACSTATSSCASCRAGAGGSRARVELPVKLLFPRGDAAQHGRAARRPRAPRAAADVEVVDGGHFLLDEQPELVADRARAWFG